MGTTLACRAHNTYSLIQIDVDIIAKDKRY